MCGIFGKFFFEKTAIDSRDYQKYLDCLRHRGPDDQGFYCDDRIILGSRRLSIIDLSVAGRMPMCNEDGSLWIVFNGEIYNFLDLRKRLEKRHRFRSRTDSEVVLHLFEEKGADCLKDLRGMFAFAIWNARKKELFLARDRLGKKPMKFFYNNKFFMFASELKAILKDPAVPREIDYRAIDEFLTYQYVPSPKTGYRGIYKLEPAHYLIVRQAGEIVKKRYWRLDFSKKLSLSEAEWEEKILEKLRESVRLRMMSDVPLGAHLSGGIDSSMVVSMMCEVSRTRVKTFSIGFEETDYNELPYARLVAKKYNTDHHELIVKPRMIDILPKLVYHYEEPYADPSMLPTWHLCEVTKKNVTVALNGDGGDENFAGYTRYGVYKLYTHLRNLPFKEFWSRVSGIAYRLTKMGIMRKSYKFFQSYDKNQAIFYLKLIDYFDQEQKDALYTDSLKKRVMKSRWQSFLESKLEEAKDLDWLDRLLYADINSYLPDDLFVKTDIAGMAHSLEIRSPFLDHEFMELVARMPSRFKMKGYARKYILKKIAKTYLPKQNIYRFKQGFGSPFEHWFRKELGAIVEDTLLDRRFVSMGFFNKRAIEQMIIRHTKGEDNYSNQLWALMILREWFLQ